MNDSQTTNLEMMNKRRELMEDGRRYIIFYTFGEEVLHHRDTETQRKDEEIQSKEEQSKNDL